jgi:hypothetical protein
MEEIKMKKRNSKQIAHAGATLITGMAFLPFVPINRRSRWSNIKTTSKSKRGMYTKI